MTTSQPAVVPAHPATFAALAVPNFRRYVSGQSLSLIGTWVETVAQALLVLRLTHSGTILGLTTAARYAPILLLSPYAGLLVDRYPKRRVLLGTQAGLGLVSAALGVAVLAGDIRLWQVVVLAVLFGVLSAVDNPARQAFVQEVVGHDLGNAVTLGIAELWSFRICEAEGHLERGIALARRIGRPLLEINGLAHWGLVASFRSSALAVQRGLQAIELAQRHGWGGEPSAAIAYPMLAASLIWQGKLDEAERWLMEGEYALRSEVEPATGMLFHLVRAFLEIARGRAEVALAALRAVERLPGGLLIAAHPLTTEVRAFLLHVLVRLGETARADAALTETAESERERPGIRTAVAALRLAQDNPRAATAALAPVLDGSAPGTHQVWLISALLLEASARDALGEWEAAGRALEQWLDLAEPDGVLFPFLLHPVPKLLERHARQRTAHAALIRKIVSVPGGRTPAAPPAAPPEHLPEPLSQAEARVLRFLQTSLSAPEIARELYVSVNTVRTHMRHLYDKLGAHRRLEALDRARALGLLTPVPQRALPGRSTSRVLSGLVTRVSPACCRGGG
jgi:DNA-binding CsgD family transcriptional regulator